MFPSKHSANFIAISRAVTELNRRLQELEELQPVIAKLLKSCSETLEIVEQNITYLHTSINEPKDKLPDS